MPFAWFVALRYLRAAKGQTGMILAAVSVGVSVVVFLSALIGGLQDSLIEKTLGSQAHVTLQPPREAPRALAQATSARAIARTVQPSPQRLRSIDGWPSWMAEIEGTPGVRAVSPLLVGPGFVLRGLAREPVLIRGVDRDRFLTIIDLRKKLVAGRLDLDGDGVAIGSVLADTLGVVVGDKLRLTTKAASEDVVTITGIFRIGSEAVDRSWLITSLRHAQSLFALPGGASALELKVNQVFEAEAIAQALANRTGLKADSWMKLNAELLAGLSAQSSSKFVIQFFVILAVALGIASVLAVSVVQKSPQIGILRAVGTAPRRVLAIFLIQGGVLGLGGSILGSAFGALLSKVFEGLARGADGGARFPVTLPVSLFVSASVLATGVGLLAAVIPARRAARIDPAQAIRNG